MSQRFLSLFAISSIAFATTITSAIVPASSTAANDGTLKMVMIDQAQLTNPQRSAFQRYLQNANLPPTKIGKRCQFYGKPEVWCLLLDPPVASQVYQQLKGQPIFGSATEIKEVRRLKGTERS